jgi:flagellar biosynthesis component FlhA
MPHVVLIAVSVLLALSLFLPEPQVDNSKADSQRVVFEPVLAHSIQIEVSQNAVPSIPPLEQLSKAIEGIRQYAFEKWGLVLQRPGIGLWSGAEGVYRILIRGMEVFRDEGTTRDGLWDELEVELRRILDLYKVDLIDDGATRRALDYVEREIPDLVNGVVPNVATLTQMTALLRSLLREGITTRHLDIILQTIAEHGSRLSERQILAEVRSSLAPVISASVAEGRTIKGAVIEPVIDLVLGKAEESGSLVSGELVDLICEQVEGLAEKRVPLVASKRARAYLRDVVRVRWANVTVIAHEEIAPRFEFESVSEIKLNSDEQRHALVQGMI